MAESTLVPKGRNLRKTFQEHLSRTWRRRSFSHIYYDVRALRAWMCKRDTHQSMTHVGRLLHEVYDNSRHIIHPIDESEILNDSLPCILLFSILLEIDHPDLIDNFRRQNITDNTLPFAANYYNDLKQDLRRNAIPDIEKIVDTFETRKWAYCPAPINLMTPSTFYGGKWILPFVERERIIQADGNQKGGTAEVWQVLIQADQLSQEMQDALSSSRINHREFGPCYQLAVKSYLDKNWQFFHWETQAFRALRNQPGMLQSFGEYSIEEESPNGSIVRTHNILLEYGENDLEEYFAEHNSPILPDEIFEFWESLFEVAEAIRRIHNLDYQLDGNVARIINGWHADLKPENILRVHGKYKLADFGFAKFKSQGSAVPMEYLDGGTEAYAAPERHLAAKETRTAVSQTIDTWSFGTVLSIAATWVVLGADGIEQFEVLRQTAIEKLRAKRKTDNTVKVPPFDDSFHNGEKVLPEIIRWHDFLRSHKRTSDFVTGHVLDLVDSAMLLRDPGRRLTSAKLCKDLDSIMRRAQREHRNDLASQKIKDIDQEVFDALQIFEGRLEKKKMEKPSGIVSTNEHIHSTPREINVGNNSQLGESLAIPKSRGSKKSIRIGKQDKLERGPVRTANRTKVLNKDALWDGPNSTPYRYEQSKPPETPKQFGALSTHWNPGIHDSPTEIHNEFQPPQPYIFSKTPLESVDNDYENMLGIGKGKGKTEQTGIEPSAPYESPTPIDNFLPQIQHKIPTHYGRPLREELVPEAQPEAEAPNVIYPQWETLPPHMQPSKNTVPAESPANSIQRAVQLPIARKPSYSQRISDSEAITSHSLSQNLVVNEKVDGHPPRISSETLKDPGRIVSAEHTSDNTSSHYPVTPHRTQSISPAEDFTIRDEYDITVVRKRLESQRSVFRKRKKDEVLKNFIFNRDMVFVVDNGTTMFRSWDAVTYVLETLVMKLGPLDENGPDLKFAFNQENNLKDTKPLAKFQAAMKAARPAPPATENDRRKTNIGVLLGQLFNEFKNQLFRTAVTLVILTDGRFEGTLDYEAVNDQIVNFLKSVPRSRNFDKTPFSIQFVRFGNNERAKNQLTYWDDQLPKDYPGIPDAIDHVSWTGKVTKMLAGSFVEDLDAEEDEEESSSYSVSASPPLDSDSEQHSQFPPYSNSDPRVGAGPSFSHLPPSRRGTNRTDITYTPRDENRHSRFLGRIKKFI